MKMARWFGTVALACASAAALAGQAAAVARAGRIRLAFGGLESRAAEVSEVTLDGPMLRLGIRMLSAQDHDARARQVLQELKGVYVKSFRFRHQDEYSNRDLKDVRRQLQAPGWTHIISVHSHGDRKDVDVYVKTGAGGVEGMAIIAAYPKELRVVNLVGPIDPAALSRLGGHFGIPRVAARNQLPPAGGNGGKQRGRRQP